LRCFVRQIGFKNIFYIEGANVLYMSNELFDLYSEEEPNITMVIQDDIKSFRSLSEKAGLTMSDWMQTDEGV